MHHGHLLNRDSKRACLKEAAARSAKALDDL